MVIERGYDMLNFLKVSNLKHVGLFAAGALFGTAGVKVLSSKDAKKVYVHGTAAVLRAKDCVMKTVALVQENAEDILAEAKQINEERLAEEEAKVIESVTKEDVEEVESGEQETVKTAEETPIGGTVVIE